MLTLTIKTFVKDIKNHAVYLMFLTFLIAAITLFSNLMTMQNSYIQVSSSTFNLADVSSMRYDLLSLIVIMLLIFLGFYAFQFYLNNQAKLLSIFRLGGSNFYKILIFMLLQLLIIFGVASILGFGLGCVMFQFMNSYICQIMGLPIKEVVITVEAVLYVICIVGVELVYLLLIMFGFVYRHEIKELLRYQESFDPKKAVKKKEPSRKFQLILAIIFAVIYIAIIIGTKGTYGGFFIAGTIISSAAFPLLLRNGISEIIKKMKEKTKDTNKYIGLSHLDFNLRKMIGYLILFSILLVVISGLMIDAYSVYENFVYNISVYLILSIIFVFSIIYQLVLNMGSRKQDFRQLIKLGKTQKDLKKIINVEITGFFIILFCTTFLFPSLTFISAVIYGAISVGVVVMLIVFSIMLFIIAYFITKFIYNSTIKDIG